MKNLSALLLCGAICFTPIPAFANEVSADTEQSAAVFSNYKDYDGWVYNQPIFGDTILTAPCDGTITISYNNLSEFDTIKVVDSSGKVLAEIKSGYSGTSLSLPVKAGTYYLKITKSSHLYVRAVFSTSENFNGWVFNGYWYAKSNPNFEPSTKNEIWCYFKNGQYLNGWQYINNGWYYFGDPGSAEIGTSTNGIGDGYMACSTWVYKHDFENRTYTRYYVGSSGRMASNTWIKVDGNWYYAKKDGSIMTNSWLYSKGKWYWLDEDGVMAANEWIEQDGKWYYLRPSGAMAANETICGNKFDSHGVWLGKA